MALHRMLLQQKLLLGALILAVTAASQPDLSCNNTCGNLSIPYPFGTSKGCYLDPSFLITCSYSFRTPKPFLLDSTIDVLSISLLDGELRVSNLVARDCYNESGFPVNGFDTLFTSPYFTFSYMRNKFTIVGCDTYAFIFGSGEQNYTTGCTAYCDRIDSVVNGSCSGIGCCQTPIAKGISDFNLSVKSYKNYSAVRNFNLCGFAFLVEAEAYNFSSLDLTNLRDRVKVPVVLDWAVGYETCEDAKVNMTSYACKAEYSECYNSTNGAGYRCNCSTGYQGNPYLPHGCTGN
jgi:hypothetical protein